MARKVEILLVDDVDGGEADETIEFGIDGVQYEIDLSYTNATQMRDTLAAYLDSARRVGRPKPGAVRRTTSGRSASVTPIRPAAAVSPKLVRVWAAENGIEVNSRGRISDAIIEQYKQATGQ